MVLAGFGKAIGSGRTQREQNVLTPCVKMPLLRGESDSLILNAKSRGSHPGCIENRKALDGCGIRMLRREDTRISESVKPSKVHIRTYLYVRRTEKVSLSTDV